MKKIGLSLLLLFIMEISFAGSPGTYREQLYEIIDQIEEVLKESDYNCVECFLYKPLATGFAINFYQINDKNIINKITSLAIDKYYENNEEIYIRLKFYNASHKNKGFFDKSFISLHLNKQGE